MDNAAEVAVPQVHEHAPPRLVREWYAAWASGSLSREIAEEFGWRVANARDIPDGPAAEALFDLHVMGRTARFDRNARKVKDWGYIAAARFVASRRGTARFKGYELPWGHQAARDGLWRAMWPEMASPGREARAKQFGITERPYVRVREHVRCEAEYLLLEFESVLSQLHGID